MTEEKVINFEEDAGTSEKNDIETLSVLSREQLQIESNIANLNDQLNKQNEELKKLQQDRIPSIMEALHLGSFSLDTGEGISIKRGYFGSIKDNEVEAFEWLKKYNLDDIIKNMITISLGREESEKADELVKYLEKMEYNIERKEAINANTLKAFIKERLIGRDELEDAWLDTDGVICNEGDNNWNKYLEFAKSRDQEADLTFPKHVFKVFMIDKAIIAMPKKRGRK